jgi:energy-coupling factor transporter ATP-binding protein EcfA2
MYKSVRFQNFKSLKDFTIHLRATNVLVGPNNAGKSTVLDAFRVLSIAHGLASRRLPQTIEIRNRPILGYELPASQIPISLMNIHSDYQADRETTVTFSLENGNKLRLEFHDNSRCVLTTESPNRISSTAQFKKQFPTSIYSFPTLGPLEEQESLLNDDYVRQSIGTRRAHRMFRNIWYRWSEEFPLFQDLVEQTWEGMSISKPELDVKYPPTLSMFCKEGRVDRELCWAGFGFQVWLQILTHICNSASADVLVVDEPEIYLHPDMQHKLFKLLKTTNKQIILATHSAEMVNEAEHDDVVVVDKTKRHASRVTDVDGLQEALFSIGSAQNIHLARLSKGKKILFLEGEDFRLLRRFADQLGFTNFSNDTNITAVPIGGFSQRQRIQHAAWAFEKVLKANIAIAALLDRDFRCREEIDELVREARKTVPCFHVLSGKEIENYLLAPSAIAKGANDRLRERGLTDHLSTKQVSDILSSICNASRSNALSQHISNRMRFFGTRTAKDPATVAKEAITLFDNEWEAADSCLMVAPGKQVLATLNTQLQEKFGISITATQIIRNLKDNEIAPDLCKILKSLDDFSRNNRMAQRNSRSAA